MAILQPSEYDQSYFDGHIGPYSHNAGYSQYGRVEYQTKSFRFLPTLEDCTGWFYGDMMKGLDINLNHRFIGKSVLVLGCAYGFEVKWLRELGVLAEGIDVSPYAISQAEPSVAPYLMQGDIRTVILGFKNKSYNYILSRWLLECMSDADLAALIPEMNRICKNDQVHIVNPNGNAEYYNVKTMEQWAALPFATGTILIPNDDFANYQIVI